MYLRLRWLVVLQNQRFPVKVVTLRFHHLRRPGPSLFVHVVQAETH